MTSTRRRTTWNSSSSRRTTRTTRNRSARRTSTRNTRTTKAANRRTHWSASQWRPIRQDLTARIASFRTIHQQVSGPGNNTPFSPTAAKSWIRFVNNGCYVYKFSNSQFNKFFGKFFGANPNPSPTAACRFLKSQFGNGIKAVARGKGNTWLVAASPNVNARPFSTYTFK